MALLRGPRQDQPRLRSFPLLGGGILGVLLGAGVVTAAVSFEHPLAPPASLSRADRSAAPPNVVDLPSRPSALLPTGCATLGLDEPNASSRDSMSVAGPRSTDPAAPRLLCAVDVPAGRTTPLDVGTIQPAGQEFRLTVAPAHGVATRTGMTLLYTPAVGYAGPDRLVYETAAHGSGATTEVSFTVLPPPAALKLELPRGAAFGLRQTIPLSWTVQGDDADAPLLVRAQEPGTLDAMTGSYAPSPGARPPNGPSHYLRPDGVWADAPTVYTPRASSSAATIALPTNSAGAWRIELLLRDPLTGGIRASSGQTLLVADRPSIFLTVGHPIVRPGARVQAGLLVNPGTVPDDVRVLAGLTRPDGTDVLLDTSAVERSEAGLIDLPERPLGDDLPGSYRVWARLVDRRSGAVVGLADAGFAVCASSSPIRGVVVDPSGNAVSPSAASIGHVVALDVDAGGLAGSASLDDAGAYRLDVAPGRYLLLGQILDRSGWREASALDVVTAGCGDVAAPVDLVADPPAPVPGLQASPPMPPLTASRVDQCSLADADPAKPLLAVHDQVGGGASSRGVAGRVLTEIFAGDLVGAAPGVAVTTADTRGALAALAVLPPAFPGDAASQVVLPGRAADFLLVLGYRAAGPAPVLAASLEDVANGEVIWRDEAAAPLGADGVGTATIADLANRLARPGGQSLPCFLRAFRPPSVAFSPSTRGLRLATIASPGAVDVALSLEGAAPASFAGQPFKVTARVRVDGAAVAAVPVEFSLRGPGTLGQSTAQTDDAGDAVVQYTAPPTGSGTSLLSAVVLMGGRHVAQTLAIPYRPAASCGGADVRFCITDLGSLPATGPLPRPAVSSGRVLGGAGIGGDMAVRPVDHVEYLQTVVDQRGGVRLTQAYTTGDDGQVLAFGMVDGQPHALLLTPR